MNEAQVPQWAGLMPMVLIFGIFYFIVVLPHKKQQKQHQDMISDLQKNDKVVTMGGIHGVIVNVKEKTFTLRVDDNTRIDIDKTAVSAKVE